MQPLHNLPFCFITLHIVLLVFFLLQAFPADIKNLIDNRGLLLEARNMLQQLDTTSVALNSFQDDTSNLSDCTKN